MKKLAVSVALAALFLCALPSAAAINYCVGHHLGATGAHILTRTVVVDSSGKECDVKDIGSANSWIAAKTTGRSLTSRWLIDVHGASYTETAVTSVPSYTIVHANPSFASGSTAHVGQVKLSVSATTGSLITMGDFSVWDGINVTPTATTTTGVIKAFDSTGVTATILNTTVTIPTGLADTSNTYGFYNGAAGVLDLTNCNFLSVGTRTKTWGLLNLGESATVTGGHWAGSASQLMMFQNNISAKTLALTGVRIDTLAGGTDLTNTAGTLKAFFTPYVTSSGTITGTAAPLSATATALAANGANCSAGNAPLGVDASGAAETCTAYQAAQVAMPTNANDACVAGTFSANASFAAFCVATNTWVRVAIATWP
jgi:hypothetical protein